MEKDFENSGTEILAIPSFIYIYWIIMNEGVKGVAILEWTQSLLFLVLLVALPSSSIRYAR